MLDRFSIQARRAVGHAGEEARRLGHPHVGTEHLLLGLLDGDDDPAARILRSAGAPLGACREKVVEALARRDFPAAPPANADLDLTDRAARALDRAGKLSLRLKSEEVSTAHVLLSVLDVEGTAGQVLRGLGVDLVALREDLTEVTTGPDATSGSAAAERIAVQEVPVADVAQTPEPAGADPVCATCGKPLRSTLAHTVLTSRGAMSFEVTYCSSCGAALGVVPLRNPD